MSTILFWLITAFGLLMVAVTLASLLKRPHWLIRMWDFPRLQIAMIAGTSATLYAFFYSDWGGTDWLFLIALAASTIWQIYKILPYTRLVACEVKSAHQQNEEGSVKIVMSNVLMSNRKYEQWWEVVQKVDPDIILIVEPDHDWARALDFLEEDYPYVLKQPQDNLYGIILYSRFQLVEPRIRFIVEDDIPSVHCSVQLPDQRRFCLRGLHPRPPQPFKDQHSGPRDVELIIVAREVAEEDGPVVVTGDLNDVAWSQTTELFQRISCLLDPRRGRGMFNTYNANLPLLRFPLDHVFHSKHFSLVDLTRLDHVGSDHFPIYFALSLEPFLEQEEPEPEPEDEQEAQERIDLEKERGVETDSPKEDQPARRKEE